MSEWLSVPAITRRMVGQKDYAVIVIAVRLNSHNQTVEYLVLDQQKSGSQLVRTVNANMIL